MNKIKLSQFDIFGTFRLSKEETVGIRNLVHKLDRNQYLSRNVDYYPTKWDSCRKLLRFSDICHEYEYLNAFLPWHGKTAFVICEKMHELATRVVNTIQQQQKIHLFQNGEYFDTVAQRCAQECANNLVRLFHGKMALRTATKLQEEDRLSPNTLLDDRVIQADNKKQLFLCANALPEDIEHLITPGRGSSKLGTMVQAVRGYQGLKPLGITQVYYSLYANKRSARAFAKAVPQNLPEKLLLMDDDVDTGRTIFRIKQELIKQGHQVTNGAMVATFYTDKDGNKYGGESVFKKRNWHNYVDIIPNQFGDYFSQTKLKYALQEASKLGNHYAFYAEPPIDINYELNRLITDPSYHGDKHHSADYLAMRKAEELAGKLGADLYHVSAKISPAAVAYNQKIREQVLTYDR